MASDVDIGNRALQKLGAKRIVSLTEDTKNARAINVALMPCLLAMLTEHDWNCVTARVQLPADAVVPIFGKANSFTLPADYLRLSNTDPEDNCSPRDFKIEGKKIFTNEQAPLNVIYIRIPSDLNDLDALLTEALSTKIALETCEEITQSNTKKDSLKVDFERDMLKANKANAFSKVPQKAPISDWISKRR